MKLSFINGGFFFAELMSVLTKKIKIYDVLYWCFELFVEK